MVTSTQRARRAAADVELAAVARRQLGLFTRAQALRAGLSDGSLGRRVADGRYRRRWPGVFAVAGVPETRDHRYLAAVLHLGGEAVLSHATAATVHGLEHRLPDDGIHLLVRTRSYRPSNHLTVHRSAELAAADTTTVGVLPVTDVTWTLTDLAGLVDPDRLRKLVSAGVRRRATGAGRLRALLERRPKLAGRAVLCRIVDELSPLEPATREELESLFLRVMNAAGLPPTAMNHPVRDIDGRRRDLDAVYLPERVWVELDSRAFHGTLLDWNDDLRRENGVKLVGWSDPLRFTFADLRDRPHEVVAVVRTALARTRVEGRGGA
jgi:hypothetical protein